MGGMMEDSIMWRREILGEDEEQDMLARMRRLMLIEVTRREESCILD